MFLVFSLLADPIGGLSIPINLFKSAYFYGIIQKLVFSADMLRYFTSQLTPSFFDQREQVLKNIFVMAPLPQQDY